LLNNVKRERFRLFHNLGMEAALCVFLNRKFCRLKILFLADLNSAHVVKWVSALSEQGHQIGIFSLNRADNDWYTSVPGVQVFSTATLSRETFQGRGWSKLVYLKARGDLKKAISAFGPDILHAHYATSYGLLGAVSGFHPFFISAWGSDVMDFPNRSVLHKLLLRNNFKKADLILATSQTIADCIAGLSDRAAVILPFGIDTAVFMPGRSGLGFSANELVVGTIKALEPVYATDVLIQAFALSCKALPELRLRLLIVGGGSRLEQCKALAASLGISERVRFTGRVRYEEVPEYHRSIDIFANLSHSESFGVSVLEAEASSKPVIVTETGGLKEVFLTGITGIGIRPGDIAAAAAAIQRLALDAGLRESMGAAGRIFVLERFGWQKCVSRMEALYREAIAAKR
jgi:glycosyltransferase involved in cell wall biosynthesis